MVRSLACVVNDEEFLILDDDETDSTQAIPESPNTSEVRSGSDNSITIGFLGLSLIHI